MCPICLSPSTKIATPSGEILVTQLHEDDLVYSQNKNGQRVAVPIKHIASTPVPATHTLLKITLNDGRVIQASPGHPTYNAGEILQDLKASQPYNGSVIANIKEIPTTHSYTVDILPDSDTGTYWADGILVGSTLR